MGRETWTSEWEAELRLLNATTRMSMDEMACAINDKFGTKFTRSSIIGKINRLKIRDARPIKNMAGDGSRIRREKKAPIIDQHLVRRVVAAKAIPYDPGPPSTHGVTIHELRLRSCRWPDGAWDQRPPYRYCGKKTVSPSVAWCPHHFKMSMRGGRDDRHNGGDWEVGGGGEQPEAEVTVGRRDDSAAQAAE